MDGAMGGGGTGLTGEAGPELSLPWGTGPRPLYWPMNEPSSLNWMSTLSPYSARESSLPSLLSPHRDGWLSERFSSASLREEKEKVRGAAAIHRCIGNYYDIRFIDLQI